MTIPTTPGLDGLDPELTRLLTDRAAAIHPRGTSAVHLARRAGRIRHQRRIAAAGIGVAATAVLASVVVTRPSSTDQGDRVEAGFADGGAGPVGSTAPVASTVPGDGVTVTTATRNTIPIGLAPLASGAPLRLGLDAGVEGATVSSVFDNPTADERDPRLGMTVPQLFEGANGRSITVLVTFPPEAGLADVPGPNTPAGSVDLGDGTIARIAKTTPVGGYSSDTAVTFDEDGVRISLIGKGTTDEELLEVGRGLTIEQDVDTSEVGLDWLPDDMRLSDWFSAPSMTSFQIRSSVGYTLANGQQVEIGVSSRVDGMFESELAQAREAPDPVVSSVLSSSEVRSLRTVRGVDAVVKAAPFRTEISWVEPSGHFVRMFILAPKEPTTVPDASLVDSLVELDEATFQELVATHPAP
jgi:hypothetical protein